MPTRKSTTAQPQPTTTATAAEPEPTAADESPRPGVSVYAVRAPFATVTQPGNGPHAPAVDKLLSRGQIVPAWAPPSQVANLLRNGLIERVHGYADPVIEAPAPPSTPPAPAVWEPGRRYRVTGAAVVVPGHGSPIYRNATLPKDVDHATIDRLLAQRMIEPKALPA